MSTPYEQGLRDGSWTDAQIRECGFSSARECLSHQERVYQEEMAKLPRLYAKNPTYAARQQEYMEGWIVGVRQSLRGKR